MMMRRCCCFLFAIVIAFSFIPKVRADQTLPAYCVMPLHSDALLAESNADEWLNVAGLTKLPAVITLCSAFDKGLISEEAVVTVGSKAASIGGPSAYLKKGETICAGELIRAAVMISAGDAIYALAEHAFGSEDVFLDNITLTLRAAGITKELPECLGTYMTFSCKELCSLGELAVDSPTFLKYCSQKYVILEHTDGRKTELASANKLLTSLPGCIGLFTGSSNTDGYCGIFACKRGETTYLCAIIGAQNSKTRFETAAKLLEEAFANYRYVAVCDPNEPVLEQYPVEGGDVESVDLYAKERFVLLLKKSDGEPQKRMDLAETLTAPLDAEHAVGTISYYGADGSLLLEAALYPGNSVSANGFREILKRVFGAFLND